MKRLNINKIVKRCALVTLAGLMSGCVTNTVTDDQELCPKSTLTFNFIVPENSVSRADAGVDNGVAGESTIRNIKVWIFTNNGSEKIGYGEIANATSQQAADNTLRLKVEVPTTYISSTCDIFALANADAATSTTLDTNTTRSTLENLTFAAAPTDLTNGLPMARIAQGISIADFVNTDTPVAMSLLRSVSKIGVYFTEDTQMGATQVIVKNVTINNGITTGAGYLFPTAVAYANASGYATAAHVPTTGITAGSLAYYTGSYTLSTAKEISGAITIPSPTDGDALKNTLNTNAEYISGPTYYLESNTAATCTVTYSIGGGTDVSKTFNLWDPSLIRHHEVVIYGHFKGGNLYVTPTVLPWTDATKVSFDMSDIRATIAPAKDAIIKKSDTAVFASYDASSAGTTYPKFTVTFTKPAVDRWLIQSTNPYFGFKINLSDDIKDYVEGVGGSDNAVTFYVVPKNEYSVATFDATPILYNTTLFMTVPNVPSMGRIYFNSTDYKSTGTAVLPGTTQGVNIQQIRASEYASK
jgi:hypothetical protein